MLDKIVDDDADTHGGVRIRYGCKCGHLAPVGSLFFSEMCQKPVCRLPRCSTEEFESYYCSYMLVNMPSKEASMYQNRSSRCFSCVDCGTVLSTAFHDALQKYFFVCAHCRWDSIALGLLDDDPDTLVMSAVARERESAQEDVYHALLSYYSTAPSTRTSRVNSAYPSVATAIGVSPGALVRGRSMSLQSLADSMKELQRDQQMKKFRLQRMAEMGGWKYEQALEKIEQREQWLADQRSEHEWPELKRQLEHLPLLQAASQESAAATREHLTTLARQSHMSDVSSLPQRLANPLEQHRDVTQLFPSRPALRVKRAWRCVESMERGSAGILVKPQISPMSGDSSLPIPASWFKKANLAIHYMPIVTIQRLPTRVNDSGDIECTLLIENPLDEAIRVVCRAIDEVAETDSAAIRLGKVIIEDFTPILIGPYEDPNIAEAFVNDPGATDSTMGDRNTMLVSSTRNLAKIKLHIEAPVSADSICVRLQLEMEKYDEELHEAIENSALSFPVEVAAGIAARALEMH